jgi:hypothetical protein
VGIGTDPSNWKSTWKALNIGQSVGLFSQDNNTTGLSSNVIFDGSDWTNKNIGATAFYQQSEGAHYFYGNGSSTDAAGTIFSPTTRLTISSGGIVGIGSTGIFAGTNAILNLQGSGIALKNDKNGSNNNWSYIQNTGTGSDSDINFYTGNNASALNLSQSGDATFSGTATFKSGNNSFIDLDRNASGNAARIRYKTSSTDEFEAGLIGGIAGYHISDGSANPLLTVTSGGLVLIDSASSFTLATHTPDVITKKQFGVNTGSNTTSYGSDRIHFDTGTFYVLNQTSTGVKLTNGATAWAAQSDERLKENIKPLENVLNKIKNYRCVEYNLKTEKKDKKIGFIAQDWEGNFDPIISKDDEGLLGMKYTETIPVLLKAIQEQQTIIEDLKARIETLEG